MTEKPEGYYDEEGGICNVCGGGVRYGDRHSTCGAAVMKIERKYKVLQEAAQALVRAVDNDSGYEPSRSVTAKAADTLRAVLEK